MTGPPRFAHDFPFDPSYGYSDAELDAIAPPPAAAGFDRFWTETFAENAAIPLALSRKRLPFDGDHELWELSFTGWRGMRLGAWALLPRGRPAAYGAVIGHGYGAPAMPGAAAPGGGVSPDAACIYACAPGFALSASDRIPDRVEDHVVHRIDSREDYLIRACVASLWSTASALLELRPEVAGRLQYLGGSFGGGLGALALPWDRRFRSGFLCVPTFGHHPIRLQCPCVGSGESVRRYHQRHPEVVEVLAYYDAAVAASRIRIPVLASPARFDPAVPPPGQFAVCNAIADRSMMILAAGHFYHPGEVAEGKLNEQRLRAWLDACI